MASTLEFAEYRPDLTDLGPTSSTNITNCRPQADGYGPFPDLSTFTKALPTPCRGYFFARNPDGSIAIFAGTATELYLLNNSDFSWTVVSQATYSPLVTTDNWQFVQFNSLVIAVQQNVAPQKFTLGSSTAFANLGGSPPFAGRVAIVGFFVVLTKLLSAAARVQWSDLDAPEVWTAGVGLADFQDLPDGGSTHGCAGGDAYGIVFQDESIRSFTYAPGSPAIFQINRISTQETLFAEYSIINIGARVFYLGAAGFKLITAGGEPEPIGKEKIDRTFFNDVDVSNLQLVIGAPSPETTRVYWAYKSKAGNAGLFDKILCYDWALKRWTTIEMSGQYIASLAKPGITLEQLDAIAPGALTVTGAANNGAGLIRLTLTAISNAFFHIAGQNFIEVQGVLGTTEANGSWPVNIIDATHIDLIGSAFVNAYVSGGAIGGSLDALPFSLDSVAKASVAQLSAIGPTNMCGFFVGPNLEALAETQEIDGEGTKLFTTGVRAMTDASTALLSIGFRDNANVALSYTEETPIDDQGWGPLMVESRYQKGRMRIPYGSNWNYMRGIAPDGQGAGER